MTPEEVREVSARRLYKEDERNKDTLAELMENEKRAIDHPAQSCADTHNA